LLGCSFSFEAALEAAGDQIDDPIIKCDGVFITN